VNRINTVKTDTSIINPIVRVNTPLDSQRQPLPDDRPDARKKLPEDQDQLRRQPTEFVFRGEVLDSVFNDNRFRPQFNQRVNQQIDPRNQSAISTYESTSANPLSDNSIGLILDRFI